MEQEFSGEQLSQVLTKLLNKDDKDLKHQAHGMTQGEMKAHKEAQSRGEVEMMDANRVSRHRIPVAEKNFVHYTTEMPAYDPNTGEKKSKPRHHISTIVDFDRMSRSEKIGNESENPENAFSGKKVVILHDPRAPKADVPSQRKSEDELIAMMSDEQLAEQYYQIYGEDPHPSDTRKQIIEMLKEKMYPQN